MKKEFVELVVKDLEMLISHLKELLVDEEDGKVKKPRAEPSKKISLEDLRAVLAKLSQHGKTAEVKDLITKYGATKLSDVDEGKYKDLLKDAEGIKID
ncbi:MAG: hypothetical protein E6970_00050 [Peptostreptococcus sp.]|uniref:hypothetical protein n=1 Tax=Peptostreptococcus TaxID=1257 RepID=UPI0007678883|nr:MULTISPECIES: hypothetical protein [Peptostreptococcus]KXB71902.1 hypothetical protein HMPREF3183_00842 [Peptostreptococcus anaerobius]MDU1264193.1 hypothetical protein [Peptostreptococcus sp.]